MSQRVLLLHGIWNAKAWLGPLARRLRAEGLEVEVFGYPSVLGGPDVAVPLLIKRLRDSEPVTLLGHSLGGLVALEALQREPALPVTRVVCLGSPLRGSDAARSLAARRWISPALGRSAGLLQRGFERWEGQPQVGAIAGNVPHGLGRHFARFQGESDGTVSLEETRLPGLADHCVVAASHSGLVFSAEAARQAAHFLGHGRFAPPV
ncbi:alpha/beta hydrolase [Pseudoxanthomonas gei]|uniref:Alpha/beta hydrolase n=1 Tax=Pseudoxanthomonas gei TaxID=1383030 RepID=A0ABX0AFV4_9GAMM|nr:alpha/beta fold hydrolase [Pseudoxanthomonas gei]NDK38109.1 alpha/beta hydrolase [Pseudoxanthomonas gei]